MQEIINNNEELIFLIIGVIVLIIVALFIIIFIERRNKLKYYKELEENYSYKKIEEPKQNFEEEIEQDEIVHKINDTSDVIYQEQETKEEAKIKLEEATKKLTEDKDDIIGQTSFEKMQEETSIISYEELINKNLDVDSLNDQVLEDEGNEPITLDELYKYNEQEQVEQFEEPQKTPVTLKEEPKEEITYYVNSESKKFKNSDVISPVFGIKRDIVFKKEYNELGETINIKELDMEIKKTEEFLKELKKLKSKLN